MVSKSTRSSGSSNWRWKTPPTEASGGSRRSPLRADVQGLRAVAVLLVIGSHVFDVPRGGFIGVDVFFVISGFLITGLLTRALDREGRVSLRDFYQRRARRILPMAIVALAATDVVAHVLFNPLRAHQTAVDSWWAFGFLANVHFASLGTDYFAAHNAQSAVQQFWSLAVEEQFYLVWPWVLFAAFVVGRRFGARRSTAVAVMALAVVAASFATSVHLTRVDPSGAYFSALTRAWELGIGALASMLPARVVSVSARRRALASWSGLAAIVASAFVITPSTPFPGWAAAAPVVGTAVVLAAGDPRHGVGARLGLGGAPSQYVGQISYSLYLWHWPALIFATAYFGASRIAAQLVAVVAAFLLSALSYVAVEQPFRHLHPRRVLKPALIGAPALAVVLVWSLVSGGAAGALAPTTLNYATLQSAIRTSASARAWGALNPPLVSLRHSGAPEMMRDGCLTTSPASEARCVYGRASAPHLAVVLGDSIAASYMPALRGALPAKQWRIQMLTMSSCAMVDAPMQVDDDHTEENPRCTEHHAWVRQEVQRLQPELVIMASNYDAANQMIGGGPRDSAKNFAMWQRALTHTIVELSGSGRRFVVITAPPRSGKLEECVTQVSRPADCNGTLSAGWRAVSRAEHVAAETTGATYVDPSAWFCFRQVCPAVIGHTPVYWDGMHLTAAYARTLSPLVAKPLLGQ